MRTPKLETERLILREVQKEDVNDIFSCWMQDEEVSRYMWWKASKDIAKAEKFVQFELGQIDKSEWNRWIIVDKNTNEVIGTCLVFWNDEDAKPHWDDRMCYNICESKYGLSQCTTQTRI